MSREHQQFAAYAAGLGLPSDTVRLLDGVYRPVAGWLAHLRRQQTPPLLIGINGAQGSGKSTFCALIEPLLLSSHGLRAVTLSIDDVYRTRHERRSLAAEIHPLCAVRGVPGTHDIALAERIINQLLLGQAPVSIPRFDKATDDRKPPSEWNTVNAPVDIILFEGWCVGCPELPRWEAPHNPRERRDDPDGQWMRWSAECLETAYTDLFQRLNALIMIAVPSMATVRESRWLQEQRLWERHSRRPSTSPRPVGLMSHEEIVDYVALFERYTEHMLRVLPARADALIRRDEAFHYTLARLPAFEGTTL